MYFPKLAESFWGSPVWHPGKLTIGRIENVEFKVDAILIIHEL